MTMTNALGEPRPAGGDLHVHVHGTSGPTPEPVTAAVPPTAAAPVAEEVTEPNADSADARLAEVEARLDAIEAFLADQAMSEVDAMAAAAALPEPETPAPAPAEQ